MDRLLKKHRIRNHENYNKNTYLLAYVMFGEISLYGSGTWTLGKHISQTSLFCMWAFHPEISPFSSFFSYFYTEFNNCVSANKCFQ